MNLVRDRDLSPETERNDPRIAFWTDWKAVYLAGWSSVSLRELGRPHEAAVWTGARADPRIPCRGAVIAIQVADHRGRKTWPRNTIPRGAATTVTGECFAAEHMNPVRDRFRGRQLPFRIDVEGMALMIRRIKLGRVAPIAAPLAGEWIPFNGTRRALPEGANILTVF